VLLFEAEALLNNTVFKNSVHVSSRTTDFTITSTNFSRLIKEVLAVYIETHTKPIKINTALLIVKIAGPYKYR
jgi:hypothetical protein